MLRNSYVGKGYKYGILFDPSYFDQRIIDLANKADSNVPCEKAMETSIRTTEGQIISFDDADGLTLNDLAQYSSLLLHNNHLFFVMYDSFDFPEHFFRGYHVNSSNNNLNDNAVIHYVYAVDVTKDSDEKIDDVISRHLLSYINQLKYTNQCRAMGFLETYRFGTKKETDAYLDSTFHYIRV